MLYKRFNIERLEPRRLFSATAPTPDEQYMLELINRARANPSAEASRDGIDLNEGLPAGTISTVAKQPLAFNPDLIDSALAHSQWMIANQLFQHDGPGTTDPGQRMQQAGYIFGGTSGWGENIAYEGSTGSINSTSTTADEEKGLFVDSGISGRGHRTNLDDASFKEMGVGISTGIFNGYNALLATQDFAYTTGNSFLTGVAYNDTVTADHFYTPGEGLGGIVVTATRASDNAVFTTTTWSAGGYSLALAPGTYHIAAAGTGLPGTMDDGTMTISNQNVEADFTPASASVPIAAVAPTATLNAHNLTGSKSVYLFSVTYTGDVAIDTTTFDKHDILVIGPSGLREYAQAISHKATNGGKTQTVTYRLVAPVKKWSSSNNGVYHVYVRGNQVSDVDGNSVIAKLLGYFKMRIA